MSRGLSNDQSMKCVAMEGGFDCDGFIDGSCCVCAGVAAEFMWVLAFCCVYVLLHGSRRALVEEKPVRGVAG